MQQIVLVGTVVCGALTSFAALGWADDSIESKYLQQPRQITHDFAKAGEGYFSPDGQSIVFQAIPKDYVFYQIFEQSLAGETLSQSNRPSERSSLSCR